MLIWFTLAHFAKMFEFRKSTGNRMNIPISPRQDDIDFQHVVAQGLLGREVKTKAWTR